MSSKQEAGNWGLLSLPGEMNFVMHKVIRSYANEKEVYDFKKDELLLIKNYIASNVQELLR
ncbi:aminoglycoside adenylyltransferase domain-containing protein [Virgibacillus ndiopensis]|uniref:aminoglycoside adenylyltransferase domain-containing protein n=1 Tax=Virgibacillus ndiopensis TaxID=2004408 RepID=UPI002481F2AC|nr:aminoglycoside adenylyltransferase domain-containing protein [Virgibacillus ndiopensis]